MISTHPTGAARWGAHLAGVLLLAGSAVPGAARPAHGRAGSSEAGLARVDPALRALVQRHSARRLGVIVQTEPDATARVRQAVLGLGGKAGQPFRLVEGFAATLSSRGLARIARMPGVRDISGDLHTEATGDCLATGKVLVPPGHLRRVTGAEAVTHAEITDPSGQPLDGRGVLVGVFDTGIKQSEDLVHGYRQKDGRIEIKSAVWKVDQYVLSDGRKCKADHDDQNGHGTHIAGLIAGDGHQLLDARTGQPYFPGMAPGAILYDLKVLDRKGGGSVAAVIAGLQDLADAVNLQGTIGVVNLSLGHPVTESYRTDPLCQACEQLWKEKNIVVVVAAGNGGRGQALTDSQGNVLGYAPAYGTIESPGNDPLVITVGAINTRKTDDLSDDVMATYSAKGPTAIDHILKPDLLAPGNRLVSLNFGSRLQDAYPGSVYDKEKRYIELSGTSMAAAVVSGAVALLRQKDPAATPDDIKARLMATARKGIPNPDGSPANIFECGAGVLDVFAAVQNHGHIVEGHAWSPLVQRDPNKPGLVHLTTQPFQVEGGVGSNQALWGDNALWGDTALWSDQALWGDCALWADQALWGDNALWSDQAIWSDIALWSDQSIRTDMVSSTGVCTDLGETAGFGDPDQ